MIMKTKAMLTAALILLCSVSMWGQPLGTFPTVMEQEMAIRVLGAIAVAFMAREFRELREEEEEEECGLGICADEPCGDHGLCVRTNSGYRCVCDEGYEGTYFCSKFNPFKDYCNVEPLETFDPKLAEGKWWAWRFNPPSDNLPEIKLRFAFDITLLDNGNIQRTESARLSVAPFDCKFTSRTFRPLGNVNGTYSWTSCDDIEALNLADVYVAAVDYDRYLVFFWCNPSFENCSPSAAVYTRDPIADAELNEFLEEFMMEKFCVDTTEWINIQRADVDDCD